MYRQRRTCTRLYRGFSLPVNQDNLWMQMSLRYNSQHSWLPIHNFVWLTWQASTTRVKNLRWKNETQARVKSRVKIKRKKVELRREWTYAMLSAEITVCGAIDFGNVDILRCLESSSEINPCWSQTFAVSTPTQHKMHKSGTMTGSSFYTLLLSKLEAVMRGR